MNTQRTSTEEAATCQGAPQITTHILSIPVGLVRSKKFSKAPTEHRGVWFGLVCYCAEQGIDDGRIRFVFREVRDGVQKYVRKEGIRILDEPSLLWYFKGEYLVVRLKP